MIIIPNMNQQYQLHDRLSPDSLNPPREEQILGNISIISKDNTAHNQSLVQNIWEYEHDPGDHQIQNAFFERQKNVKKRHSYQNIDTKGYLISINGTITNADQFLYHSQMNRLGPNQGRSEYGLIKRKQPSNETIQKKNRKGQDRKKKKPQSFSDRSKSDRRRTYLDQNQEAKKILDLESVTNIQLVTLNRESDILTHKKMSNLNYLMRQTKELMGLIRLQTVHNEAEETRKKIMKFEIDCRKLKIGLRNNSSSGGLIELRRKQYIGASKTKRSIMKPTKAHKERERILSDLITKEKKKIIQLTARQARINNHLNYLKSRVLDSPYNADYEERNVNKNLQNGSNFQSKFKPSQFSTSLSTAVDFKNYQELLATKREVLRSSIEETGQHIDRKCQQLREEIKIFQTQLAIIIDSVDKCAGIKQKLKRLEVLGEPVSSLSKESAFNSHFSRRINNLTHNRVQLTGKSIKQKSENPSFKNSHGKDQHCSHKTIFPTTTASSSSKSKRKLVFRSPNSRSKQTYNLSKQSPTPSKEHSRQNKTGSRRLSDSREGVDSQKKNQYYLRSNTSSYKSR